MAVKCEDGQWSMGDNMSCLQTFEFLLVSSTYKTNLCLIFEEE